MLNNRFIRMLAGFVGAAAVMTAPAYALDIKQQQIDACVQGAVTYQVADDATATQLCTCTIDVRSRMTIGQMWAIESHASSGKDPSTLPFAKKMQQDLQQCTAGLDLNPPKRPS